MTTHRNEVARFNAMFSGSPSPREAERLAADPAARAFRVEERPVPIELTGATPAYLALLDQVEFTPEGATFPVSGSESEAA